MECAADLTLSQVSKNFISNQNNLDRIFNPTSIAVVGASDRNPSIGRSLLENFFKNGFQGNVYPINPKNSSVMGLPSYSSLSKVNEPIDLAIIVTKIDIAPKVIKECGLLNIGGAVVISSGGKEAGENGARIEADILREAQTGNVRVIGPNCLGFLNTAAELNASFGHVLPKRGGVAFVSQSGGVTTAFLDFAITEDIGCSYVVSVGSMIDVDFGDTIEYLKNDPKTKAIFIYSESLTNPRKFCEIAKRVSRVKPIFLLKVGRTAAGAMAALSHTGALAGDHLVYSAALEEAGVVQIQTLNDLFDCADMLAKQPLPASPALSIVTNTGGPGVMAADELHTLGIQPPEIAPKTIDRLNSILSPFWSHRNPVDILGDASPETFKKAAEICAGSHEFDAILLMNTPQAQVPSADRAKALCEYFESANLPVFCAWIGTEEVAASKRLFRRVGIPVYDSPERAVRAFAYACRYVSLKSKLNGEQSASMTTMRTDYDQARSLILNVLQEKRNLLTEFESKKLLESYGIPTIPTKRAATSEQAVRFARQMHFPVVLKVDSETITHKTDVGGVKLDLNSEAEVEQAFTEIMDSVSQNVPKAQLSGVSVQPMIRIRGHELLLGAKRDKHFGPIILFGMGGIFTEIFRDTAIGFAPLDRNRARRIIQDTKVYRLLKGYRGLPKAELGLLEEILVRLSWLIYEVREIEELDINPLLVLDDGALCLDARVLVSG